jgi:hypothetical protein
MKNSEKKKRNVRKGYWILFTMYYCPSCGGERVYKERVYDKPKPDDWNERNTVIDAYDYCDM